MKTPEIKHLNIMVKGWVQGVGFRYSAMQAARSFNVRGFVRNEPDGSVYIEAEGEEADLGYFIDWCSKGPSFGRVDEVLRTESGLRGFEEFRILH